jgi:hypothetical protein
LEDHVEFHLKRGKKSTAEILEDTNIELGNLFGNLTYGQQLSVLLSIKHQK